MNLIEAYLNSIIEKEAVHPVHKVVSDLKSAGYDPQVSRGKDGSHEVHTHVVDNRHGSPEAHQITSAKYHDIVGKHQKTNREAGHTHTQSVGTKYSENDRHSMNTMHFSVKSKQD